VLLEADAAVLDLHVDGHRVAFNRAFDVRRWPQACDFPDVAVHMLRQGLGNGAEVLLPRVHIIWSALVHLFCGNVARHHRSARLNCCGMSVWS